MASARAASEPAHMARYRGRVYFCFPCPRETRSGPSHLHHSTGRAGADQGGPVCPPPASPSSPQRDRTNLAVEEVLDLAVLGLVVVLEDDLAPAQPQLGVLGLGDLRVHGAQPLHVACEGEPSPLLTQILPAPGSPAPQGWVRPCGCSPRLAPGARRGRHGW